MIDPFSENVVITIGKPDKSPDLEKGSAHFLLGVHVYDCRDGFGTVVIAGQRHRVGPGGIRALRLLIRFFSLVDGNHNRPELFAALRELRGRLISLDRNVTGIGVRVLLNRLIRHTSREDRRRLFIWMRGLLGGYSGKRVIGALASHRDWWVRKKLLARFSECGPGICWKRWRSRIPIRAFERWRSRT